MIKWRVLLCLALICRPLYVSACEDKPVFATTIGQLVREQDLGYETIKVEFSFQFDNVDPQEFENNENIRRIVESIRNDTQININRVIRAKCDRESSLYNLHRQPRFLPALFVVTLVISTYYITTLLNGHEVSKTKFSNLASEFAGMFKSMEFEATIRIRYLEQLENAIRSIEDIFSAKDLSLSENPLVESLLTHLHRQSKRLVSSHFEFQNCVGVNIFGKIFVQTTPSEKVLTVEQLTTIGHIDLNTTHYEKLNVPEYMAKSEKAYFALDLSKCQYQPSGLRVCNNFALTTSKCSPHALDQCNKTIQEVRGLFVKSNYVDSCAHISTNMPNLIHFKNQIATHVDTRVYQGNFWVQLNKRDYLIVGETIVNGTGDYWRIEMSLKPTINNSLNANLMNQAERIKTEAEAPSDGTEEWLRRFSDCVFTWFDSPMKKVVWACIGVVFFGIVVGLLIYSCRRCKAKSCCCCCC